MILNTRVELLWGLGVKKKSFVGTEIKELGTSGFSKLQEYSSTDLRIRKWILIENTGAKESHPDVKAINDILANRREASQDRHSAFNTVAGIANVIFALINIYLAK